MEVKHAVVAGYREKSKDEHKREYDAWNCAIRGRTVDGRRLRVVISFEEETSMLIITAVDLGRNAGG
jgi:hypothetical protein